MKTLEWPLNPFQVSVAFDIETVSCTANQMTGFYIECNTGPKWVNPNHKNKKLELSFSQTIMQYLKK